MLCVAEPLQSRHKLPVVHRYNNWVAADKVHYELKKKKWLAGTVDDRAVYRDPLHVIFRLSEEFPCIAACSDLGRFIPVIMNNDLSSLELLINGPGSPEGGVNPSYSLTITSPLSLAPPERSRELISTLKKKKITPAQTILVKNLMRISWKHKNDPMHHSWFEWDWL